ncbi:MAG: amidohydrolase family protein [Actinomycetota bacterium]
MVIDSHVHLEHELPVPGLLRAMDDAGVDRAILLAAAQEKIPSIPRTGTALLRGCLRIPPLRIPVYRMARRNRRLQPFIRPDNDAVLEAARAHPDRFIPFAFVNPTLGQEAHDELDRALAAGAVGLKLHAWLHDYRLIDAIPFLQRCEREGLPVLVHLGLGPPEDVEAVLDRCPKLKLVLAHGGIPHFERLWQVPRVRFDVALRALVSESTIMRMLAAVGPDRVLFGSDAPPGLRAGDGHRYELPRLPDRAMGANVEALLG